MYVYDLRNDLEKVLSMKGKVRGTVSLEGWNTKIASGKREKTRLCGNIASLSTMARSRPSPCLLLEVFKAALKDKSTRQSGSLPTLLITFWIASQNSTKHQLWGWWPPMVSRQNKVKRRWWWEAEEGVAELREGSRRREASKTFTFTFLSLWLWRVSVYFHSVYAWKRYERDRNMLQNSIH